MSNQNNSVAVTRVILIQWLKYTAGNNNQDLVWKFCVLEQNVQCC